MIEVVLPGDRGIAEFPDNTSEQEIITRIYNTFPEIQERHDLKAEQQFVRTQAVASDIEEAVISGAEKAVGAVGSVAEGILSLPRRVMAVPSQLAATVGLIPPERAQTPETFIPQFPELPTEFTQKHPIVSRVATGVGNVLESLGDPNNLLFFGGGPQIGEVGRAFFGASMLTGAAEKAGQAAGIASVKGQRIESVAPLTEAVVLGSMGIGVARMEKSKPADLTGVAAEMETKGVQNAIPERGAEAVPVGEAPASSQAVVGEVRRAEEPAGAQAPLQGGEPARELARGPQGETRDQVEPLTPPSPQGTERPTALGPKPDVAEGGVFSKDKLITPASETTGIVPSAGGLPDFTPLKRWFTREFSVFGDLPKSVQESKLKMEQLQGVADTHIRYAQKQLYDAIQETYGLSKLQMLGGGSRRIPPEAVKAMDRYLKGDPGVAKQIPAKIAGVIDNMRAEKEYWSTQLIDVLNQQIGRLPEGSAERATLEKRVELIKDNMDVYIHRSYKFFDSKHPAPDWYEKLSPSVRDAAEQLILGDMPPGSTIEQARSRVLDWLSDLKEGGPTRAGSTLGAKDPSIFMHRRLKSPELKAVLGEYNDPLINWAKTISKTVDWIAKQTFLTEVREKGLGDFLFEEGVNPPGYNARLAAEGNTAMSPLSGLRTKQEIADAFKELEGATSPGSYMRAYLTLNAATKVANTVYSQLTQARNLLSRTWSAGYAGHWNVPQIGTAVKAIWSDISSEPGNWKDYLDNATKLGVIRDTSRHAEMREVVRDAGFQDQTPASLYSWSFAQFYKNAVHKPLSAAYRASDELGMIYGWECEKILQRKVHPNWSAKEIDAESAKIVRDLYQVYSLTPRIVKSLRSNVLVAPFPTFSYQMWRTAINGVSRSIMEIKSANPAERNVGKMRLASQIATLSATAVFNRGTAALLGIALSEQDDFRLFQPPWARNSRWIFTGKDEKTGEISAVNASYIDPFSVLTDPLLAIKGAIRRGDNPVDAALHIGGELLRPFTSPQMLATAIEEAYRGETDMGREVWNKTDSGWEKIVKISSHIAKTMLPATIQRAERRGIPAFRDEQPQYGRKLEPAIEVFRELTGVAYEKFNYKTALAYKAREFVTNDKAAEDKFRFPATRIQKTGPQEVYDAYVEANKRKLAIWQDMRQAYVAAIRRGVSDQEAQSILRSRQVSKTDAKKISQGLFQPYEISPQVKSRAAELKRILPMEQIKAYSKSMQDMRLEP